MATRSSSPLVTVAMSVCNQGPYVARAVRSVLAQTYRRFEFLIIDDGSRDSTPRILRSIRDPRLRVTILRGNLGKGVRMNQLLRRARGRYLLEMDGDDWLEPHALGVLIREMNRLPPSVAVVYGDRRFHFTVRRRPRAIIRLGQQFRGRVAFLRRPLVSGPRFYRVAALRAVGGWPTNYPSRGRLVEDLAVMLRLVRRYSFRRIPRVLYNVRKHGRNVTSRYRRQVGVAAIFLVRRERRRAGLPERFGPPRRPRVQARRRVQPRPRVQARRRVQPRRRVLARRPVRRPVRTLRRVRSISRIRKNRGR